MALFSCSGFVSCMISSAAVPIKTKPGGGGAKSTCTKHNLANGTYNAEHTLFRSPLKIHLHKRMLFSFGVNSFTPTFAYAFLSALLAYSNKESRGEHPVFYHDFFSSKERAYSSWLRLFLEKKDGGTSPGEKQGMHEKVQRNVQENDIEVTGDGGLG